MDSLSFHMQVLWRGVSRAVERHETDGVPLNQPERAWILVAASPSFASWSGSYRRRSPRFRSVMGARHLGGFLLPLGLAVLASATQSSSKVSDPYVQPPKQLSRL